jgi:hypothetical protein
MADLMLDSPYVPVLLTVYGSHVTTTMAPVLATVLATPRTVSNVTEKAVNFSSLNATQFSGEYRSQPYCQYSALLTCIIVLLSSYIPFLIIPLLMSIDGINRLVRQVDRALEVEKANKRL